MSKKDEALKLALEAFEADASNENFLVLKHCVREALDEQPAQQDEYGYAKRLAEWLWQKHYAKDAPDWVPFDNLAGVLTQIDNMVCRLVKEQPAPVAEPVAWRHDMGEENGGWEYFEEASCPDCQPLYKD